MSLRVVPETGLAEPAQPAGGTGADEALAGAALRALRVRPVWGGLVVAGPVRGTTWLVVHATGVQPATIRADLRYLAWRQWRLVAAGGWWLGLMVAAALANLPVPATVAGTAVVAGLAALVADRWVTASATARQVRTDFVALEVTMPGRRGPQVSPLLAAFVAQSWGPIAVENRDVALDGPVSAVVACQVITLGMVCDYLVLAGSPASDVDAARQRLWDAVRGDVEP